MQPSALILIGVLTPTSGILGSLAWPVLQRRLQWSNLKVIVVLVLMASAIPAYGCLGFLSVFEGRFGGLTTQGEMFVLAVFFGEIDLRVFLNLVLIPCGVGSVYGAFEGYARAFYAELLPPGEEARWYVSSYRPPHLCPFTTDLSVLGTAYSQSPTRYIPASSFSHP